MNEWENQAEEMLNPALGTLMQQELDDWDWELQRQKMIDYMDACSEEKIISNIQEGDIRCLKRVPIVKYWESPRQISKPASDKAIQDFLSVEDDMPYITVGKLWIIFGVLFLFFLLLL